MSATQATTCAVTATKAASAGYNAVTSPAKNFVFQVSNQTTLTIANSVLTNIPGSQVILTTNGGSGTGAVTFNVTGSSCSISERLLIALSVTTCSVIATKAASLGYNAISSTSISFIFQIANQAPLLISNNVVEFTVSPYGYFNTVILGTTGGSGMGAVSFSVSGSNCALGGPVRGQMLGADNLVVTAATTCVVTATKAASTGYNVITSSAKSFTFLTSNQLPLVIVNTTNLRRAGSGYTIETTGGSGTGLISLSTASPGCIVGTNSITGLSLDSNIPTSCVITATKAASIGYNSVTSLPKTLYFEIVNQDPLTISNTSVTRLVSSSFTLGTVGGSGSGAVSFATTSPGCSISGSTLTTTNFSASSTCVVTATRAASVGYNVITSAAKSFAFEIVNQDPLTISNTSVTRLVSSSFTLGTVGGSGSGAVSFATTSPGCSISGSTLTTTNFSASSTCVVTATRAASVGYNVITSAAKSFAFTLP